jgi:hypothetical protein
MWGRILVKNKNPPPENVRVKGKIASPDHLGGLTTVSSVD